jgi:hypothetical protein
VTARLPAAARRILAEGILCHLAARTPAAPGPHLTPVVFVLDGGRLWLTTSRSSVKARAWRQDPAVAGLVRAGEAAVAFRGRVRTYDALDPLSWPAATVAGPRLIRAATRFSLKNARFFAGYAVDASNVPFAWTPPGRVFVGIDLLAGVVLDGGEVVAGWGTWRGGAAFRRSFAAGPRRRGLDLRVPADVRRAVGSTGRGAVAFDAGDELSVLPVAWRRIAAEGSYDAVMARALAEMSAAAPRSPAALTVDVASSWRASAMVGMLLQGPPELFAADTVSRGRAALGGRLGGQAGGPAALVRIRPGRIVWWRGWTSGTVRAG